MTAPVGPSILLHGHYVVSMSLEVRLWFFRASIITKGERSMVLKWYQKQDVFYLKDITVFFTIMFPSLMWCVGNQYDVLDIEKH